MKILLITPSVPYPPHTGGQLRSWYLLRDLAKRGSVTLISIGKPDQYERYMSELEKYCHQVLLADPKKFESNENVGRLSSMKQRLMKLVRLQPWLLDDFVDPEILRQIELAKPEEHDLIVCRFTIMAYYFLSHKRFKPLLDRVIVDIDDVSPVVLERKIGAMKLSYRKLRSLLDLFLLKKYYSKLRKARACFVVSEKDKNYVVQNRICTNTFMIPNVFEVNGRTLTGTSQAENPEILFCGMMSYPPNQDAVLFFSGKIFPEIKAAIPNAHLTVIGKHMPEKIMKLDSQAGISVAGYVPSMEPYYEKAALVVVPILNGGGTRIKILEAMAYGKPVVSTSIGAEGLEVTDGKDILIADDPNDFAKKCIDLLKDSNARNRIGSNGYQLVKEKYDLNVFHQKMEEVLEFLGGVSHASR